MMTPGLLRVRAALLRRQQAVVELLRAEDEVQLAIAGLDDTELWRLRRDTANLLTSTLAEAANQAPKKRH